MPRLKRRRNLGGLVGIIWDGGVIGSSSHEPDIMKVRHEQFMPGVTSARFRFNAERKAVMWNSFPPTQEDMIIAENWLYKKGATPAIHACAYVYDSWVPVLLETS